MGRFWVDVDFFCARPFPYRLFCIKTIDFPIYGMERMGLAAIYCKPNLSKPRF
jgi:hypothetical protein